MPRVKGGGGPSKIATLLKKRARGPYLVLQSSKSVREGFKHLLRDGLLRAKEAYPINMKVSGWENV